ncbi:MAG TPA: HigA family addiction module antitoxin [Ignavibacteriales bacterium]|nr:HigA family addiction module antitoxin [Ignavibacteriales bacterium]
MTTNQLYSNLPIPPGEFLEEVLEDMGMTKDEFAKRMNRPAAKMSLIFQGKKEMTPETALQLEKVTEVPAHIWSGLEKEYRLALARAENEKNIEGKSDELPLIKRYCYSNLAELGIIEKKKGQYEQLDQLHKFFGVTSLFNISKISRYQILFRQASNAKGNISEEALTAWLRIGEREAYQAECSSFNKEKLRESLSVIRSMTLKPISEFQTELKLVLGSCGIAFIVAPHFPKTYAHGASFWISKDKAVIMNTLRYKWADIFWFSLFHELGHIILHGSNELFIESSSVDFGKEEKERQADNFASSQLIPKKEYDSFMLRSSFYENDIKNFSSTIGVHPGIVVGRLQHDKKIKTSWHNGLRVKYSI